MKFIRTKDDLFGFFGIMSISLGKENPKGKYFRSVVDRKIHRLGAGVLQDKYIVKQADTIEELCDNGIIIDLNGKHTITYYLKEKKCWLMGDRKYIGVFYGAIWTPKGLIYVAKMNDKGELELL